MPSCLWGIQAATELLADGERNAEGTGPSHGGYGACWVQQGKIHASRFLSLKHGIKEALFLMTKADLIELMDAMPCSKHREMNAPTLRWLNIELPCMKSY